jgi:general stress protein 26
MKKGIYLLMTICLFACVKQDTLKKELKEVAFEIITASKNCALITVDSSGVANARTMDPFLPDEDFTIWMATNPKSKKVKEIQHNSKVTLYYFDKDDPGYVTVQGTAFLVNSQKEKEKFWKEEWNNFYKNRTTDYLLIKVIPSKLNIISEKYEILGDSITWKSPEIRFK